MLAGLSLQVQAANTNSDCVLPSAVFYSHYKTIAAMSSQPEEAPSTSAESIKALRFLAGMPTLQADKPHPTNSGELDHGGICGNPLAATFPYMVCKTPDTTRSMPFRSALLAGLSTLLGKSSDVSNSTLCYGFSTKQPFIFCRNEQLCGQAI